jgi:hypothetical protein
VNAPTANLNFFLNQIGFAAGWSARHYRPPVPRIRGRRPSFSPTAHVTRRHIDGPAVGRPHTLPAKLVTADGRMPARPHIRLPTNLLNVRTCT